MAIVSFTSALAMLSLGAFSGDKVQRCMVATAIIGAILPEDTKIDDQIVPQAPEYPMDIIVGSDGMPGVTNITAKSMFWRNGWVGSRPPKELVDKWLSAPYRPVNFCQGLKTTTKIGSWIMREHFKKNRALSRSLASIRIFHFSEPVLNFTNNMALVVYSFEENTVAGKTEIVFLKGAHGSWWIAGRRLIDVS